MNLLCRPPEFAKGFCHEAVEIDQPMFNETKFADMSGIVYGQFHLKMSGSSGQETVWTSCQELISIPFSHTLRIPMMHWDALLTTCFATPSIVNYLDS